MVPYNGSLIRSIQNRVVGFDGRTGLPIWPIVFILGMRFRERALESMDDGERTSRD